MIYDIDKNLKSLNFKRKRSLKHNLSLILNDKSTSHLVSIEKFNKGSYLLKEREPVKGIFFILNGKAKIFNTGSSRKTQTLRLVSNGDIVGFSSLNATYYWSSALVVEETTVYFINLKNLKTILKSNNKLGLLFLNAVAVRLRHYEIRQKHLSLFPAPERIIDSLLLTAFKFGVKTKRGLEISICNSRKDLSSFANTSIEQVSRTLSYLNSEKIISIEGKSIIIIDKNNLINRIKSYGSLQNDSEEFYFCYPDLYY